MTSARRISWIRSIKALNFGFLLEPEAPDLLGDNTLDLGREPNAPSGVPRCCCARLEISRVLRKRDAIRK
ncbi:MAG: hypothetical protein CTY36_16450 [Methylocystis sp.]|nr:MAG: hypothetical protein CTY36_16450 [Methylocystis sp.]